MEWNMAIGLTVEFTIGEGQNEAFEALGRGEVARSVLMFE